MASSTIPAVKAALVAKIAEAVADEYPDLTVNYGEKHAAKGRRIDVLDTLRGGGNSRAWKSLKASNPVSNVEEVYALPIIIYRPGEQDESMQEIVEYCFAVFALIEAQLRTPADVTLGVAGVWDVELSSGAHEEIVTDQGFGCKLHSGALIKARI